MKAILPVAGLSTRLYPISEHKPKALIEVAGKPVLEHILLNLADTEVSEVVFVVGHLKDQLMQWLDENFRQRFELLYVEQTELLGLGHAVYQAKEYLGDDEAIVMLGDEVFSKSYQSMIDCCKNDTSIHASVGTMHVEDVSHYGMVRLDHEGYVQYMEEKPQNFDGNQALAGVYYFKRGRYLRDALEQSLQRPYEGREYQLTDALQLMVESGKKLSSFSVGEGYDCGRPVSLLVSNRRLLLNNHFIDASAATSDSIIHPPCIIEKGARVASSEIGPYASIGKGASVDSSLLKDVIVESNTRVENAEISFSIVSQGMKIELDRSEQKLVERVNRVS